MVVAVLAASSSAYADDLEISTRESLGLDLDKLREHLRRELASSVSAPRALRLARSSAVQIEYVLQLADGREIARTLDLDDVRADRERVVALAIAEAVREEPPARDMPAQDTPTDVSSEGALGSRKPAAREVSPPPPRQQGSSARESPAVRTQSAARWRVAGSAAFGGRVFSGGALALEPALDLRIERGAIRVELGARYLGSWQDSAIAAGSLRLDGGLGSARAGWHTPIGARFELGVAPSFAVGAVRAVGSSDSITTLATGHTLPFMMMTLDVAFEVRVVHDVAICVAVDGGAIPLGVAARTNGVIELDASGATLGLRVFARTPRF